MTLIRKLVSAVCLVSAFTSFSASNAQDVTSPNVVTNNWTGTTPTSSVGGFSGGYTPGYNSTDNSIVFGYTNSTVTQSIAINAALSAAGTGVLLKGYSYSWQYYNEGMNVGTLSGQISLTSASGSILESYNYNMGLTSGGWASMSGTQMFGAQYPLTAVGNLDISFTGKDNRFWAGYYGPIVKNVNVGLVYGVDPCVQNPAYATTCPGFSSIVETGNLVPNPSAAASWGYSIYNGFAIAKAFENIDNGPGLQIHGFKYGFYAAAYDYCAAQFIICWDERYPAAAVGVNITNKAGASLYSDSHYIKNNSGWFNYTALLPSSKTLSDLGTFHFTAATADAGYVGGMYARAIYTPSLCKIDPLSSPTCPGYFTALATSTPAAPIAETIAVSEPVKEASTIAATSPTSTVASSSPVESSASSAATSSSEKSSESKPTVSLSTILSIVRAEQDRVSNVERAVVKEAVEIAVAASDKAKQEAEATAASLTASSIATSQETTKVEMVQAQSTRVQTESSSSASQTRASTSVVSVSVLRTNTPVTVEAEEKVSTQLGSLEFNKIEPIKSDTTESVKPITVAGSEPLRLPEVSKEDNTIVVNASQTSSEAPRPTATLKEEVKITSTDTAISLLVPNSQTTVAEVVTVTQEKIEIPAPVIVKDTNVASSETRQETIKLAEPVQTKSENVQVDVASTVVERPSIVVKEEAKESTTLLSSSIEIKQPVKEETAPVAITEQKIELRPAVRAEVKVVESTKQEEINVRPPIIQVPTAAANAVIQVAEPPRPSVQASQAVIATTSSEQVFEIPRPPTQVAPAAVITQQTTHTTSIVETRPVQAVTVESKQDTMVQDIPSQKALEYKPPVILVATPAQQPAATASPSQPVMQKREEPQPVEVARQEPTRAANPVPIVEFSPTRQVASQQPVPSGPAVNRNAQRNEVAGGIDIDRLATQPRDFNAYTISLVDKPFYPPKEIYRNQKTVDNERVLRLLNARSDRLHQEMIDGQYRDQTDR